MGRAEADYVISVSFFNLGARHEGRWVLGMMGADLASGAVGILKQLDTIIVDVKIYYV